MPLSATTIMVCTVVVTVATHNLAYGVIVGVLVATLFFARRVAHFTEVVEAVAPDEVKTCTRSADRSSSPPATTSSTSSTTPTTPTDVIIDLCSSQIYDSSTVAALDAIEQKYRQHGKHARSSA